MSNTSSWRFWGPHHMIDHPSTVSPCSWTLQSLPTHQAAFAHKTLLCTWLGNEWISDRSIRGCGNIRETSSVNHLKEAVRISHQLRAGSWLCEQSSHLVVAKQSLWQSLWPPPAAVSLSREDITIKNWNSGCWPRVSETDFTNYGSCKFSS